MSNLKDRIEKLMVENKSSDGLMGVRPKKITLTVTDEEIKQLKGKDIHEHINEIYTWELEGHNLHVSDLIIQGRNIIE